MKFAIKPFKIGELLPYWKSSISVNREYQRGAVWTLTQKQMLIDSLFRGYPLPLFYFHHKTAATLLGGVADTFEVIDGQQRLLALDEYYRGNWPLLDPQQDSHKMRLPARVKGAPAPWGGRLYNGLTAEQKEAFLDTPLQVVLITEADDDEVRDLFIRLQAGTTLNRQQVRDAWPGNVGPFVCQLAGKGKSLPPRVHLFGYVDNRGNRDEDIDQDTDPYVGYRQTCAQLLALFLERDRTHQGVGSLNAKDLDALYHEHTDFDPAGDIAKRFFRVLTLSSNALQIANGVRKDSGSVFRKIEIFALVMLFEELTRDPNLLVDQDIPEIASAFERVRKQLREAKLNVGRATSGPAIRGYYNEFYWGIQALLTLSRLDPNRAFTETQKVEIRQRDEGTCGICKKPVSPDEGEFDHVKPWLLGGPTTVENGRLVHSDCHPRGKAALLQAGNHH